MTKPALTHTQDDFAAEIKQATLEKNVEAHLRHYFAVHKAEGLPPSGLYYRILPLIEKPLIEMTLRATGGNQLKAANVLGLNRNTLRKKIEDLGINIATLAGEV